MTAERLSIPTAMTISRPRPEVWLHAANGALIFALALVTVAGGVVQVQTALLGMGAGVTTILFRMAALRTDEPRMRASWNWFAVTMLLLGCYCVVVAVTGERMATSFTDYGDMARYLRTAAFFSCVAALWYCVSVPRRLLARLFLDTGIVLAGVIAIVGLVLAQSSLNVSGRDLTNPLIYLWLVDLAALSLALLSLALVPRSAPRSGLLVYVSVAMAFLCAGHLGAAIATLQMAPERPGWVYLAIGLAGFTLSLMTYRYIRGMRAGVIYETVHLSAPSPVTHSMWFHIAHAVVPYSIAMSAAVLLFTSALGAGTDGVPRELAFAGATAFVVVAGLRHVVSFGENRELYVHLTELNHSLEGIVEERTNELSRRNHELEALHQVALVSAASLDLTRILQAVAEQLTLAVDASRCVIFERAADDARLNLVATFHGGATPVQMPPDLPGGSLSGVRNPVSEPAGRRTSLVERRWLDADSDAGRLLEFYDAQTAMLVPLVAGEQTIGVAELYRARPEPFNEHEVSLAEAITTQGALAAENAHAYDKARFAANHDPVTGLLNHRALHDELARLFDRAVARVAPLTVLMMDLNLFKEFNDRYGHQAGDRVLADIGQAIKQSLPATAVVARYGGDEFTAGVPDMPREMVEMFVEAIRERSAAVQEKHGYVGEGFGVSIGLASYPEDGASLADVIAKADQAMYEDKWRLKGFVDRRRDSPAALELERSARAS